MVKGTVLLVVLFLLSTGATVWALGETDVLLQKELKSETARTAVQAVKEREVRLLEELRDVIRRKGKIEEERIRTAFEAISSSIYDRGQTRRTQMNKDLQSFVLRYNDSPSVAQVYLRLAELYYEQANEKFVRDMELFEEYISKHGSEPGFNEPQMPGIDYAAAIELYREFIQIFPDHPYSPEAHYLLGYTLDENGQADEAAEVYQQLIAQDPKGNLAPEAHFRLGEFQFLAAEFQAAEKEYQAVVAAKDPVFSDKAKYKLGWTQYLLEKYEDSINTFLSLVDEGEGDTDPASQTLSMRKESLQYVAISFAEKGGLRGLIRLMKERGGRSYALELYESLGQVYFDLTQYQEAAETYRDIIVRFPDSVRNPDLQERIIQIAGNLGGIRMALAERKRYVSLFGPGSDWNKLFQPKSRDLVRSVNSKAEEFLFEYSTYFHAESQNRKYTEKDQEQWLASAVSAYSEYISRFPESKRVTDVTFNLAEIRYEQKKWEAAGNAYRRLTQLILDPQDSTFQEAAWNMVLAYRNRLKEYQQVHPVQEYLRSLTAAEASSGRTNSTDEPVTRMEAEKQTRAGTDRGTRGAVRMERVNAKVQKDLSTKRSGRAGKLIELPEPVRDVIDADAYYLQLYPLGRRTPSVLYSIGSLFAQYHQHESSRYYFLRFLTRFPEDNFVMDAIKKIASSFVAEGRYDNLVEWGKEILKTSMGRRTDVYSYFAGILSGAMFKDARKLEENGQYLEANKVYQGLRDAYPDSEYVDEAIQNAAINFQEAARWDESNAMFRLFAATYAKSEFAPKALFQVAANYERFMDYRGAISAYEDVLQRYGATEQAKDALYNKATLAAKLLMLEEASTSYLEYLKRYKGAKDESDILFFAANSFYQLGRYKEAIGNYERFLKKATDAKPERLLQVYHELGQSYEKSGDLKAADTWQKKLIAYTEAHLADPEPINTRYAAELSFQYVMTEFKEYDGIKLRGSSTKMSKTLEKKLKDLPALNEKFLAVIKFKDPLFASASLHMIGETFMSLANMLFDAPVPADLDTEEQEMYQEELSNQAEPIEEKALESWRRNLDNAVRLGIVNEWVFKSRKKLEAISTNLARILHQEEFVVSSSEFFYDFGSGEETHADYQIKGGKVIYKDLPAGSQDALQEKYTFARFFGPYHRHLLSEIALPDLVFDYNGVQVQMDKLLHKGVQK